jgi:hypothetical protein
MTEVYLVSYWECENVTIVGIYTTHEKAKKARQEENKYCEIWNIPLDVTSNYC